MSLVEYECGDDGLAIITLNRPEVLNALSDEMIMELRDVILRFDDDEKASVAILRGEGRAFCSGADVRQRPLKSREELRRLGGAQGRGARIQDLLFGLVNWKPIISAVHNYVVGGAVAITMDTEYIIAAAGTKFRLREISLGTHSNWIWAKLKARGVGALADEVIMTDRYVTAEELLAAGMVGKVVAPDDLLPAAKDLARQIMANPPLGVRAYVRYRRWQFERVDRETWYVMEPHKLYLTDDFREAARAFVEKRPGGPYKGR